MSVKPPYEPTPERIRRMTEEIRRDWSDEEEYRRRGGKTDQKAEIPRFTIPECKVGS